MIDEGKRNGDDRDVGGVSNAGARIEFGRIFVVSGFYNSKSFILVIWTRKTTPKDAHGRQFYARIG